MAPAQETTMPVGRRTRKSISGFSPQKTTDKENATIDFGASGATTSMPAASRKKSRSKSMGPGGLDSALKSSSGNRRVSLAAPSRPPPRSILKPTMPILADIPPLRSRAKSQSRASPARAADDGRKIALRTEEQQQAAAREREERERVAREKEVNAHREARRKSLANRRVSFAAEATLHTFHEIEYVPEGAAGRQTSSAAGADELSTPPEQMDDDAKKRRRSSTGASVLGFDNDDDTMTSTVYDSDGDGDGVEEDDDDNDNVEEMESDRSDSDSDEGDGATMVTVEGDEVTSASIMSAMSAMSAMQGRSRSASPIESTGDLDEALRLATQHAGAEADRTRRQRPVGEDEEVIPAFIGWGKKAASNVSAAPSLPAVQRDDTEASMDMDMEMDMDMDMDADAGMEMEMTHAMGGIIRSAAAEKAGDEMSMDVTRVYGGIIAQLRQPMDTDSVPSSPMLMPPDDMTMGDVPMELTMAVGGIQAMTEADADADVDVDAQSVDNQGLEDMSMELTTVMGGVLSAMGAGRQRRKSVRQTMQSTIDEEPMDMTVAVGKILSGPEEDGEEEEAEMEDATMAMDMTMGMEMTTALGGILQPANEMAATPTTTRLESTARLESMSSPIVLPKMSGSSSKRTPARGFVEEKQALATSTTPMGEPMVKALTAPTAPTTPLRDSSPMRFIGSRSKSPKRGTSPAGKATAAAAAAAASTTPRSPPKSSNRLLARSPFTQNPDTGLATPSVVLTPQPKKVARPRPSLFAGVGPASPKITEIFNRRSSLVDTAPDFVVGSASKGRAVVSFDEPATGWAQDDREATQNLRELIQNLSPKKKPLKGRKSLHVGSARGLLGKRPLELEDEEADSNSNSNDNDDEGIYESQDLVKRLKGNEPSPVKNVRLQQPPSMMETIGRSSRSQAVEEQQQQPASLDSTGSEVETERIHLQDFLNMASIHFMELETTKRRPTEVGLPATNKDGSQPEDSTRDPETEELVTSVCKVPLLEMYQHACRELKNYIEEGRSIMREIETETYEENPAIFREYMTATPELRTQMDNQFKNIKIFARLQSKKQWYEWRTKLQQGLQEGMQKTLWDLEKDREVLQARRSVVDAAYPQLLAEYEGVEGEIVRLMAVARGVGDGDGVTALRQQKRQLQASLAARKRETERLQAETQASRARVAAMKAERERHLQELEEAKRVQEERRSWSHQEITTLKAQVDGLERKSGWAVTGAQGTTLSLAYRREVELVFDVRAWAEKTDTTTDLWYIGKAVDPDTETFFVQCIRDHVRSLRPAETSPARLLKVVRASWDIARQTAMQMRQLRRSFPTTTTRTSDTSMALTASVLLMMLQTKIEVKVEVGAELAERAGQAEQLPFKLAIEARVIYGEPFKAARMGEFLTARIGDATAAWVDVVEELRGKLEAQGRREK
ncbi:chromosome segregation protein [Grosmannia clavigera kw1407]|uniref:Chromosome segregation protein n=1 Tax=Grosmannia clavigera (strain kw1407 / UAMH 11150) TaxID=655863 RepID=F0XSS8_GROCL|nr:chromosome segregation protein [Grosmannia clavigera kw1407]EFW99322.1 chromosome segregation protein [Grosmannia clavigera kw1407]